MKSRIEKWLAEYSKILIFKGSNPEFLEAVCSKIPQNAESDRTLFITTDYAGEYKNVNVKAVGEKGIHEILELYYMYEFTDRLQIISSDGRFGTLFNYVGTEVLTFDEAIEAFLY